MTCYKGIKSIDSFLSSPGTTYFWLAMSKKSKPLILFILLALYGCDRVREERDNSALDSVTVAYEKAGKQIKVLEENLASAKTNYQSYKDSLSMLKAKHAKIINTEQEAITPRPSNTEVNALTSKNQQLKDEVERLKIELEKENRQFLTLKDSLGLLKTKNYPKQKVFSKESSALSEAFRILLLARSAKGRDPTLALQLIQESLKLSEDSILKAEASRVYQQNYFYKPLNKFKYPITSFDLDDNELIILLKNDSAYFYSITNDLPVLLNSFENITSAHLSSERNILLLGYGDGNIKVFDTESKTIQKTLKAHNQAITTLAFPANLNAYIISGSQDKTLQVFNKRYEKTKRLVGLRDGVKSLSVNPKYGLIAAASGDTEPRLWNFEGKLTLKLPNHPDSAFFIDISKNADRLLTTSANNARLWNLNGNLKAIHKGHKEKISAATFASKTNQIATGDKNGQILLWDSEGKYIATLKGHTDKITQLQFSEDDKYLYSGSEDGTMKRWLLKNPANLDFSVILPLSEEKKRKYRMTGY